jgi:replication-associated recombination protein RarA
MPRRLIAVRQNDSDASSTRIEGAIMGNYQSEDVWSRSTTIHGYPADEIRSALQKSIRRGWIEEAALAAYELFASGKDAEDLLWRRLEIIASEDVGFGFIEAPALIEALHAQRLRMPDPGDRWIYAAHAVRLLCTAKKDRTSMELAEWAKEVATSGERKVEIQDFMIDMHTRRGAEMGRGTEHWWKEGARLENVEGGFETKWGDYLRERFGGESSKSEAT